MAMGMPRVTSCSVSECSYNMNNECHTLAITVGDGTHAACDTFVRLQNKGGTEATGGVGACKAFNCQHNKALECIAAGISVGPHSGHADCKTFSARK